MSRTARDEVADAINKHGRYQLWWCAECHRFAPRLELHDHIEELGGLCCRCYRARPALHRRAESYCRQCAIPRRGFAYTRLLAWLVNRFGGVAMCMMCDRWFATARLHIDDDPEYGPVCAGCEGELWEMYHCREGCPACDALPPAERARREAANRDRDERQAAAVERIERQRHGDELPGAEVPA